MRELGLDHLKADPSVDRQLHQLMELYQKDGDQRSALARLCLRCRASGVAAWHLKDLVANYRNLSRRALQLELDELASFILLDKGKLDPDGARSLLRIGFSQGNPGRARPARNHPENE